MIRLLILDISGVYSQIYDELYVSPEEERKIRNTYNNLEKYLIIRTL